MVCLEVFRHSLTSLTVSCSPFACTMRCSTFRLRHRLFQRHIVCSQICSISAAELGAVTEFRICRESRSVRSHRSSRLPDSFRTERQPYTPFRVFTAIINPSTPNSFSALLSSTNAVISRIRQLSVGMTMAQVFSPSKPTRIGHRKVVSALLWTRI